MSSSNSPICVGWSGGGPSPRSCWLALLLTCREVGCLRRLVGPASLEDWRCSCLCSELIPSVTERSVLFVKELSFPQTTPTDDAFFNRTELKGVGIVGPEPGLLLDWSTGFGAVLLYKDKKEEGSVRASPVAAPMLKSVPRWEKR